MVNELIKYSSRKDYLPVQGLAELREAVATYFNQSVLSKKVFLQNKY